MFSHEFFKKLKFFYMISGPTSNACYTFLQIDIYVQVLQADGGRFYSFLLSDC